MNWTRYKNVAFGALVFAAGAFAAQTTSVFALSDAREGEAERTTKDQTTIKLEIDEGDPVVLELEEMRTGDVRTFRQNGRDVTVTREEEGYLVNVDGKEIRVATEHGAGHVVMIDGQTCKGGKGETKSFVFHSLDTEDPGETTDGGKRRVVVRRGHPGAFAFSTGDAKAASGEELLEKNDVDSLRGADARTRAAVAKALDELIAKGAVIAPGSLTTIRAGNSEGLQVIVERKKTVTK